MSDHAPAGVLAPEFTVGSVLSRTFSTFFGNFFKFLILGLALYFPIIIASFALTGSFVVDMMAGANMPEGNFWVIFVIVMLVSAATVAVVQAAVAYGAIEYLSGRSAGIGAMLKTGVRLIVPLVIAGIIAYIVMMLGFILLLIPGIIVAVMLSVTVPVIVAENAGPFKALERSSALTSGYRWQIFGAFVVVFVIALVLQFVFTFLLGMTALLGSDPFVSGTGIAAGIFALLQNALYYAFIGSLVASIYTGLRAAKEGAGADEIAKVFE